MGELPPRFEEKFIPEPNSGCWLWTAFAHNGYGRYYPTGNASDGFVQAHRFSYETLRGPIPDGLVLDHLCRVRCCVNPAHLEPVTRSENTRRGRHFNTEKTICKRGHSLERDGKWVLHRGRPARVCQPCLRIRWDEHNVRRRAARAARANV